MQRQALHPDEDRGSRVNRGLDALALAGEVRTGGLTASDAIRGALDRARRHADLGAFWWLAEERAPKRGAELDRAGDVSERPLRGVPFAVKDAFDLAGAPTTGGARGVQRRPDADAAVVARLERAGAVAVGKTAMDPLGWTTHGQAEGFPPCLNPLDARLSPGGSSSGSAVAVGAGIVPLAVGADTAGSVRIPAAYCGIVGLKPAFGTISLTGCLPLCASCDTVGLLSSSVGGCAAAYDVVAEAPGALAATRAADSGLAPERIGVLTDLFEASDPEVADACFEPIRRLEAAGAAIAEVRLGWSAPGLGLVLAAEFAAAWGAQVEAAPDGFPSAIVAAIERAKAIPVGRYEQTLGELRAGGQRLRRRLGGFQALLSPTVPAAVPGLDEEDVAVSTRFTRIFSALGWPAVSLPCGHDRRGRPVGLHVASAGATESAVFVAAVLERALADE